MKSEQNYDQVIAREPEHDDEWRERIQRALRDLRSVSANISTPSNTRPQRH